MDNVIDYKKITELKEMLEHHVLELIMMEELDAKLEYSDGLGFDLHDCYSIVIKNDFLSTTLFFIDIFYNCFILKRWGPDSINKKDELKTLSIEELSLKMTELREETIKLAIKRIF